MLADEGALADVRGGLAEAEGGVGDAVGADAGVVDLGEDAEMGELGVGVEAAPVGDGGGGHAVRLQQLGSLVGGAAGGPRPH